MPKKIQLKNTPVTRKFLTDLAKQIYDSKTRRFLRLCDGTLQNGPDPKDPKRPMHCGLGELYFAMTGVQPEVTGVDETDVVNMTVERSSFVSASKTRSQAEDGIRKLYLPSEIERSVLDALEDHADEEFETEEVAEFRRIIDDIPSDNDDNCGDACDNDTYRNRSKGVAEALRAAAKLLPA